MESHVVVCFSRGGIAGRTPAHALGNLLIAIFTRSRLTHCAAGDAEVIIDPGLDGDRAWPTSVYVARFPRLAYVVIVPTPRAPTLVLNHTPRPLWSLARRWLLGLHRPNDNPDCVRLTMRILASAGVSINENTRSPRRLIERLVGEHGGDCYAAQARRPADGEP